MSERYTIQRDGQRALRFTGTLLYKNDGSLHSGKEQLRYYTITVYQLDNVSIAVVWDYTTRWQGEDGHSAVSIFATMDEAIEALEIFDPCRWVMGFKAILARHPQYSSETSASGYFQRQLSLEQDILTRYKAQVSAVCATFDYVEDVSG